mmetsp:Transcript_60214/g.68244  ORF Transcript_60214/g.68244 Transcript_60214/m.68244 type:complete len:108 (-) Transcript_60214:962-1285(-)
MCCHVLTSSANNGNHHENTNNHQMRGDEFLLRTGTPKKNTSTSTSTSTTTTRTAIKAGTYGCLWVPQIVGERYVRYVSWRRREKGWWRSFAFFGTEQKKLPNPTVSI